MSARTACAATTTSDRPAWWLLGGRYTFIATGADTEGRMAVAETLVPPEGSPPLHVHEREDETFYVIEGRVTVILDGTEIPLGPGGSAVGPRGVPHTFRVEGPAPARMLVACAPAGFEEFVAALGEPAAGPGLPPPPAGPPDVERIAAVAEAHGIRFPPPAG